MTRERGMGELTTSDGVRLTYRDTGGEGPPLVMLHGWGRSQEMFRHQLTGPGPGRRVLTVDLRGHGLSDRPRHGQRVARLATDVIELLDHLWIDRCDAFGWSMGAAVWWSFVDQFGTARLRRLVLADQPAAVTALPWMTAEQRRETGVLFDPPALLAFVRARAGATPADAAVPLLFDHCVQDWRDVLPRIDRPTLVLGCEGGKVDPRSQEFVARAIPGARLHVFPSAEAGSDVPFLENPAAFDAVVRAFLDESAETAGGPAGADRNVECAR
ncbi:alpha/beta fold hydrolase [Streptomyces sp. NPDC090106]|uniref:alpha/beta fold hydrolase n=1 Tax=Streptomyces sp. NPDC090106 TaxID=3365946 RepID=UPI0038016EB4